MQIKAHITVEGGRLLSAANAHRIIARDSEASDPMGNRLPSPLYRFKDAPPYYQTWRIVKERKGYIFREVTHGGGIAGHRNTVRELVIATLYGFSGGHITVEVLDK